MAKLTEKQKRFADEYMIDLNATQAAIRAGYSKKSASRIAIELLNKTHVSQYLIKRMTNREQRTLISQDKVLSEIAHIAFDDIKNYLSFRTEKTVAGYEDDGTPIFKYQPIIEIKDSDKIDSRNISQISLSKDGELKFKLYPKDNALIQLAKHLGMFSDKEMLELKRQELELKGW